MYFNFKKIEMHNKNSYFMSILISQLDVLNVIAKYLKVQDLINFSETCHDIYKICKSNVLWMYAYNNTWNTNILKEELFWKDICIFRCYMTKINCTKNINDEFYLYTNFDKFDHKLLFMFSQKIKFISHLLRWKEEISKENDIIKKLCESTYFIPYKCYRNYGNFNNVIDYCKLSWIIFGTNNPIQINFKYIVKDGKMKRCHIYLGDINQ